MMATENWLLEHSWADTWPGIALLFLAFCYFFLSSLGYGRLLGKLCPATTSRLVALSNSFLLASLMLFSSAFLLAAVKGLHFFPRAALWIALFPGFCAQAVEIPRLCRHGWRNWPVFMLLAAVVFAVRALSASQPSQHGDALLYHLLGPRLWMEAGGFLMHPQLPNALLASSWECLYLWPQLLWFTSKPLFGLPEAQLFSQWLHLFLAWGGSALLLMRLFRGAIAERWLPLVGYSALFIAGLQWTAPLAKNDLGIAFWCLGALVFFLESVKEKLAWKAWLSGLFAGLALCGKITALLTLAPLLGLAFLAAKPWRNPLFFARICSLWVFGGLLGAVPIYARNYLLSGSPFFPLFPDRFPSPWLSPTWRAHFAQVHPSSPLHSIPRLWQRLPELLKESVFCAPAFLFLAWRKPIQERALLAGALAAYSIFVLTQGTEIELRYLGASLMVLGGGGICLLLELGERFLKPKQVFALACVIVITLFATSRLPLHIVRKIWAGPLGMEYVKTHTAGEAKAWLRGKAESSFTIIAGDNETYYLTPIAVTVLTERPDLDAATLGEKNLPRFVETVCKLTHARYLLDARPVIGVEAKFGEAALLPAKVFSAQGANVYDLAKLEASLFPGGQPGCR